MKKLFSFVLLIGVLVTSGAILYFYQPSVAESGPVGGDSEVGGDFLLSGWAWSSNIGWVNFGNFDPWPPGWPQYGVKISSQTGDFSGYAWSSSLGWVRFDPPGSYPAEPAHSAKIAVENGQIKDGSQVLGWARACGVFKSGCDGEPKGQSSLGGWDGWAKLTGKAQDGKDYGVTKITENSKEKLIGFAWAGDNIGWLSFYEVLISSKGQPPIFTANCSTSVTKAKINENVDWTLAVKNGDREPFRYCWGGEVGGVEGCTEPRGGQVHFKTTDPTTNRSIIISRSFNTVGEKIGYGRIKDSENQTAECEVKVTIEEDPGQKPTVDLKANGSDDPISIGKTDNLKLTWQAQNADSCVGIGGFGGWDGRDLDKQQGEYAPTDKPYPIGTHVFTIKCTNQKGEARDSVDVTVFDGTGPGKLCVISPGRVKITIQPLGTPAISTLAQVWNCGGAPLTACVKDVISRPDPSKSLARPDGGILNDEGKEKVPTCWLDLSKPLPPWGNITKKCYGDKACTVLNPDQTANVAIVVQRPLKPVSENHPYDIQIQAYEDPQKTKKLNSVTVLFEYLVTKFEEK